MNTTIENPCPKCQGAAILAHSSKCMANPCAASVWVAVVDAVDNLYHLKTFIGITRKSVLDKMYDLIKPIDADENPTTREWFYEYFNEVDAAIYVLVQQLPIEGYVSQEIT